MIPYSLKFFAAGSILALAGLAATNTHAALVTAVGVFDPAGGSDVSSVISNEVGLTLPIWQSRIGAAFGSELGGVWNASTPGTDDSVPANGVDTYDASWELTIAAGKSFTLTSTDPSFGSVPFSSVTE